MLEAAAQELASRQIWEKIRLRRRQELLEMLGLEPARERTPLAARITGSIERGDFRIERVVFESLPEFYVTANLYLPKRFSGRLPVILYVCGHSQSPDGAKTVYQRHGISFARNGYACLIVDPIQIGEVPGLHHGVFGLQFYEWYSLGYTPASIEVWNAIRALDWLATRPEIDIERAGMTGRSGGAAITWFTAAVDERVRVAAPVMGISTYVANIRANTQSRHCDCMFLVNWRRHEMAYLGGLIAPRPLWTAHGVKDLLFPVAGYTRFAELMRKLYASYGFAERFENFVVDTGHSDSDELREKALRWFDRHLLGVEGRKLEMGYEEVPGESLRVFTGSPPTGAVNARIAFIYRAPAAIELPRSSQDWAVRRRTLTERLRRDVFAHIAPPERVRASRRAIREQMDEVELEVASELTVRALVRHPRPGGGKAAAVIYLAPTGEDPASTATFLRFAGVPASAFLMQLYPRDWREQPPTATERRDLARNAMHVGASPESMRIEDVWHAAAWLATNPQVDASRLLVAVKGPDAAVGIYAAILDARIAQLALIEPAESHWQGPVILNALQVTDLREAAGLLAPRRLRFFYRMPPAYEHTRRLYALSGAQGAIGVSYSLDPEG